MDPALVIAITSLVGTVVLALKEVFFRVKRSKCFGAEIVMKDEYPPAETESPRRSAEAPQ